MGAGIYVGRVGALAVALGIGAAVFMGQGVASAKPADTTKSDTSTSTSTESTGGSDPAKATDAPDTAEKPDTATGSGDDSLPKRKKRSRAAQSPSVESPHDVADTGAIKAAKTRALPVHEDEKTVVVKDTEPAVAASLPTAEQAVSAPQESTAKEEKPKVSVVVAVSSAVSGLVNSAAGQGGDPATPENPAVWALAAASRREFLGSVTTAADEPQPVQAIPQTPLLTSLGLQRLPIIGPVFITPIVAALHMIPVVSDFLHPLIGYPQQFGGPAPRDVKVISFDGTPIYVHFMPASGLKTGERAPTILDGPGLGMPGMTNLNGTPLDDVITDFTGLVGIGTLRHAGYNVVTWDPRGEWNSGGQLEMDSPEFEGRDVQAIITWVAQQPEARLDPGVLDPRIGMVGASYGGGIQLVTAAIDHRVDAIVPTIAWHSLNSSLDKNQVFKTSTNTLLTGLLLLTGARINPRIVPSAITGLLTGQISQADQELLDDRGPDELVKNITAPTLLIQGTVDTLFSLQEADDNATVLIANKVPTKVLWFCGGHGFCANNPLDPRDGEVIKQATLDWLNRYVKGDTSVSTGPGFEWVDQRGQWFSSTAYPVTPGTSIVASSGGGTLPLLPYLGGSGIPLIPFALKAPIALNLKVPAAAQTTYIVGAPKLTLTYSGSGSSDRVFAQLVDNRTGLVLGDIATPIPVTLDGNTHTVTVSLEPVAQTLRPGESVTLQLAGSAGLYERVAPSLGTLNVSGMQLTLPTADAAAVTIVPR